MKNFKKGFTLIELLVVIAIIGILASVVLASLNTARAKGSDASIKANLSGIRPQAELVYDGNNCYADGVAASSGCAASAFTAGACAATADTIFAEPTVSNAITTATGQARNNFNACSSTANQTAYAVVVQLKSGTLTGWCIDSTGKSKQVTLSADTQAGVTAEVASGACVE
jgi:prepilin-type N-terminal cleavage/methylation domain-containing protein